MKITKDIWILLTEYDDFGQIEIVLYKDNVNNYKPYVYYTNCEDASLKKMDENDFLYFLKINIKKNSEFKFAIVGDGDIIKYEIYLGNNSDECYLLKNEKYIEPKIETKLEKIEDIEENILGSMELIEKVEDTEENISDSVEINKKIEDTEEIENIEEPEEPEDIKNIEETENIENIEEKIEIIDENYKENVDNSNKQLSFQSIIDLIDNFDFSFDEYDKKSENNQDTIINIENQKVEYVDENTNTLESNSSDEELEEKSLIIQSDKSIKKNNKKGLRFGYKLNKKIRITLIKLYRLMPNFIKGDYRRRINL